MKDNDMAEKHENLTITNNDESGHTALKVNLTSVGDFYLAATESRDIELAPGNVLTITAQKAYPQGDDAGGEQANVEAPAPAPEQSPAPEQTPAPAPEEAPVAAPEGDGTELTPAQ